MPAGVEGFISARLRIAREAKGIRQNELADRIDYAASAISKWENDQAQPEAAAIPLLARELDVATSWFFKPYSTGTKSAAFFRSMKSELEIMRSKARARLEFVEAIEEVVSNYVDLPEVDVPDYVGKRDFRTLRHEDIEHVAIRLREHWDLDEAPIDDSMLLIENAGVVVGEDVLGSPKLDGLSRWSYDKGRPFMLLAQDKNVGVRRRLDACHELGHLMLHKHVTPEEQKENFKLIEDQAMIFAGAFLLPEAYLDTLISYSLDGMLEAKREWKVSVGAQIKRLANLGLISEEAERRLWQYYSYRKWRTFEPLDDQLPVEQPQNLKEAIVMVIDDGVVSARDFIREVGISAEAVSTLTGVPDLHLQDLQENVVRLQPKLKSGDQPKEGGSGSVVPFGGKK